MVDLTYLKSSSTDSTKLRNSPWFDEDFDMSIHQRPARIHIIHPVLDTLVWISWIEIPQHDPDASKNTYKFVVMSFGRTCIRGGVCYFINIFNA